MKFILQIDGGSWRGAGALENLKQIEAGLAHYSWDIFDLIVGCSTGSIAGSCLAAGVGADSCQKLYIDHAKEIFTKRTPWPWNWSKPFFDRNIILNILKDTFKNSPLHIENPLMNQLISKFMSTSVSLLDKRNHFFKSWEDKDGKEPALEVVSWSFAAPIFFGAVDCPRLQQIFGDGGEGTNNCTLSYAIKESVRQGWDKEGVYILSLGCGSTNDTIPYSQKASVLGKIDETVTYFKKLGAKQDVIDQLDDGVVGAMRSNLIVNRIDFFIPSHMDSFTDYQYIPDLIKTADIQCSEFNNKAIQTIKELKG